LSSRTGEQLKDISGVQEQSASKENPSAGRGAKLGGGEFGILAKAVYKYC